MLPVTADSCCRSSPLLFQIEEEAPSVSLQDANGKWALLFVTPVTPHRHNIASIFSAFMPDAQFYAGAQRRGCSLPTGPFKQPRSGWRKLPDVQYRFKAVLQHRRATRRPCNPLCSCPLSASAGRCCPNRRGHRVCGAPDQVHPPDARVQHHAQRPRGLYADASCLYRGLPRIPLPLKVSGGWLEFLYVDQDMQVARGNAGGVFVLVRPRLLESLRAQPA